MSDIRNRSVQGIAVGDTFATERTFTESDVIAFADLTRDYNPVHFDERFAAAKHLSRRICHGLLVGSMLTELGGQIGWLASQMEFRFRAPVYVGDRITCEMTVTKIAQQGRAAATATFRNQDHVTVIEAGVTGLLPGPKERQVMQTMLAEGDPTNKLRHVSQAEGEES
jgi:acyl dehydratase